MKILLNLSQTLKNSFKFETCKSLIALKTNLVKKIQDFVKKIFYYFNNMEDDDDFILRNKLNSKINIDYQNIYLNKIDLKEIKDELEKMQKILDNENLKLEKNEK